MLKSIFGGLLCLYTIVPALTPLPAQAAYGDTCYAEIAEIDGIENEYGNCYPATIWDFQVTVNSPWFSYMKKGINSSEVSCGEGVYDWDSAIINFRKALNHATSFRANEMTQRHLRAALGAKELTKLGSEEAALQTWNDLTGNFGACD